eukprot:1007192-Pleurochrysis_carterae.AAC.2
MPHYMLFASGMVQEQASKRSNSPYNIAGKDVNNDVKHPRLSVAAGRLIEELGQLDGGRRNAARRSSCSPRR